MLALILLLTLAPACGNGDEEPTPGVTPTPGIKPTPGATPTPTPEAKTLKIGLLVPLSGFGAQWGLQYEQGFDMAVDKINDSGGIKVGNDIYMIKGVKGDTKFLGSATAQEATRFVYDEGIHYVVGPIANQEAIAPIIKQGKCFIAISNPSANIGPDRLYTILAAAAVDFWYSTFWDQAYQFHPEIDTVAIIASDSYMADAHVGACVAAHEAHGSDVVMKQRYTGGSADFYPVLTPIVAKNPSAIDFDGASHGEIDLMIKQIRELGYEGLLCGPTYGDPQSALEIAGPAATEGLLTNDPDYGSDFYSEATQQIYAEFQQRYPGAPLALSPAIGYSMVELYSAAIEAAGSIDPDEVMKVLDNPNFEYEAFGVPGKRLGGYETFGIRRCVQDEVAYSEVIGGKKVMKSHQDVVIP